MSSATPTQARQIMNAVSVLQKFAKTGKVGAVEAMDAKKKKRSSTKGSSTTKKRTSTGKKKGGKRKAAKK